MIRLYDKHTYYQINWNEKKEGEYVKNYFSPLFEHGVEKCIKNAQTTLFMLEIDDLLLPVTVNEKEFDNSYVCSPYTHYVSYAKEELWELHNPTLECFFSKLIDGIGYLFRKSSINRIVSVNNWFLSTNLYNRITKSQIDEITTFLTEKFPTHTIMFRSLNQNLHEEMIQDFIHSGYEKLMSRSIYLFHPKHFKSLSRKQKKDYLNDVALMKKGDFETTQPKDVMLKDIPSIKSLYESLYINKYSKHNPEFSSLFYENARKHGLLEFKILKTEEQVKGVIGYFHRNNVLTTPILGYSIESAKHKGLYRLLSLLIVEEVLDKEYIGHFSAGAGEFKRNRGSIQEIEYSVVYNKHLPLKSRLIWLFLKMIMDDIVEPMAKKKKF